MKRSRFERAARRRPIGRRENLAGSGGSHSVARRAPKPIVPKHRGADERPPLVYYIFGWMVVFALAAAVVIPVWLAADIYLAGVVAICMGGMILMEGEFAAGYIAEALPQRSKRPAR